MSYIGTNKIGKMYLGGTEIVKAYLGSNLVYQKIHSSKISGVAPLTFQANAGDISSLIQYGKCEQRNALPPGCVEVEYLESTGTQYIDTGINTTETLSYDIVCAFLDNGTNLMGAIYNPSGSTYHRCNFGVYSGFKIYYGSTSPNAWTPQSYDNSFHRFRQLISREDITDYFDDVEYNSFTRQTYNLNLNFWIFARNANINRLKIYCSCRIKSVKLQDEDNVVLADMVPVRVGTTGYMYDRVSGKLFGNSGTGNFVLGPDVVPAPDKPIDIWCNNGVLKARHQSGLPLGYTRLDYIESTGTLYIDTGVIPNQDSRIFLDVLIPRLSTGACSFGGSANGSWTPGFIVYGGNTTHKTASVYNNSDVTASSISYAANVRYTIDLNKNVYTVYNGATRKYYYSHPTGNFQLTQPIELFRINISTPRYGQFRLYLSRIYQDDVLVRHYIPSKNYNNEIGLYDLVTNTFFVNSGTGYFTAGSETLDPIVVYADGTPEVLTISATGQSTQTATAKNLLQIGDYKDTQDIISGNITRRVGVILLNGSETWNTLSNNCGYLTLIDVIHTTYTNVIGLSNKFKFQVWNDTLVPMNTNSFGFDKVAQTGITNGNLTILPDLSIYSTSTLFKQYLADQYNAGTPVMVIYPLATETTESVTAQHLTTTSGENTIDITANVSDISVEVECLT